MKRYALVGAALLLAAVSSRSGDLEAVQAPAAVKAPARSTAPARPKSAAQQPVLTASHPSTAPGAQPTTAAYRAMLDKYCVTCHNQRMKTAGVMFETMDLAQVAGHADVWEKTLRKLRAGMMPPPGARLRPDPALVTSFASWLETSLDAASAASPDPGRVALHRLNRAEYAAAIQDLLALEVDPAALLPKDDEADGFRNIATALKVSPSFLDQYVSAARKVSLEAVGNPAPKPDTETYRPPAGVDQARHVEGLPLGTRGGFAVDHLFPADGEYKFNVGGLARTFYMRGMEYQHTLVLTIDGAKIFERTIGGGEDLKALDQKQAAAVAEINGRFQNISAKLKSGQHRVVVTFVAKSFAESDELLESFRPGAGEDRLVQIGSLEIQGPFQPQGITSTPSRAKIFICEPGRGATPSVEDACATKIFSALARRAFRRPVTEKDLAAPMQFYRQSREGATFDAGIQGGMTAILASPKFLFRAEKMPANVTPGQVYRIADLDLASRLSFFLTGSTPDDALLGVAASAKLHDPVVLERQVKRLLATPESESLVTNFAFQWLKLRAMEDIDPDRVQFPNFDGSLREAFRKELDLFVNSVIHEDRSVLDLLTANYTFVNERLALHYGINNVRGTTFRRVTLEDPNRFGLLGKGGVLMATSYANRTAPVIRGAWILENILGTPPASPPPNVEGFKENQAGEKALTVRQIMEEHRANPSCNACHGVMDPIGFSLENFDAVGAWRGKDRFAGDLIDPSGVLVDGTKVNGPVDLRAAIMRHPDQFVQTFTEKLMTYGLGRTVEAHDMPFIRKIVRDAAADNYRFSSIVMGIVKSAPFQMRKSASEEELKSTRNNN